MTKLPCGATGIADPNSDIGAVICQTCFTVYGSMSCPCTRGSRLDQLDRPTPSSTTDGGEGS